jgi:hypothetical protein
MYPSISPGDILQARYKKFQEINIGEVIIFQRNGILFAHRVIRKQENVKDSGLITQADRSLSEDIALATNQNILGVLVTVERKGKLVDFSRKPLKLLPKFFFNLFLFAEAFKSKIEPFYSKILGKLSQKQIYFLFSRVLFSLSKQRLEFLFSVPFVLGKIGEFYRIISFDELKAFIYSSESKEGFCFKITLKEKHRFVANAAFSCRADRSESRCRIESLHLRMRYAAPLVISILIKKADEIIKESGNFCFFIHESDAVALRYGWVFLKSGFVKKSNYWEFNAMIQ